MKAWPVHAIFATILVCSLAARARTTDVLIEHDSLEPAVLRVARLHGLAFREQVTIAGTDRRALVFEAHGCSRPVRIGLRLLTFEEEPILQSTTEQGYVRRYVYIDHSWDRPNRLAVWVQRIKYEVLATFGQTQYIPSWYLLRIESPPDCQVANAIDWRIVWNRDYLASAVEAEREIILK